MSKETKMSFAKLWGFRIINILLMFAPFLVYTVMAYSGDASTPRMIGLTASLVIAAIITVLNIILKFKMRCVIWIVFLGIYIAMENIIPLILIVAIASILDDFVLTPLIKRAEQEYVSNKTFDKRG